MKVIGKTEYGNLDIIMLEPGDIYEGICTKCKTHTKQKVLETYIKKIKKMYKNDPGIGFFYKTKCLNCGTVLYQSGEGLEPKKLNFFERLRYKILK